MAQVLVDETGSAVFLMVCTDRDHVDATVKELDKGIAGLVSDVKHKPAKEVALNGLAGTVKRDADVIMALSALTLPHGLARIVLVEQVYRAASLLRGHPYHRE